MRLHLLALLLVCSVRVSAQQSPLRYDWKLEGITLEQSFYDLTILSGVPISFSNSDIPKLYNLQHHFRSKTIEEILEVLLANTGFYYEWYLGQVFILPDKKTASSKKYTISGYVRDLKSGEPLIGATVFQPVLGIGSETNSYGFYSLALPEGVNEVVCSYIGYQQKVLPVELYSNQKLLLYLTPSIYLDEVVVTAPLFRPVSLTSYSGTHAFRAEEMERIPALNGEADIIRINYLLPGVQTGADGFGGMSVRGGDVDQNLVLLDGVPVYNATHLLGMFSVFNTSAIRSSQFYKGVAPARFGGRLSSVVDIRTKEGNNRHWQAEADAGPASVKGFVEGPLVAGKSSMFVGARRSLIDLFSKPISRKEFAKRDIDGELSYFFSDVNAKINYRLGNRDHIYASVYAGGDNYYNTQGVSDSLSSNTALQEVNWGNAIGSLRWNRLYNDRLFSNTTLTYSRFYYRTLDEYVKEEYTDSEPAKRDYLYFQFNSSNRDIALTTDFDYRVSAASTVRFGASAISHRFLPGGLAYNTTGHFEKLNRDSIQLLLERNPQNAQELEAYAEAEMEFNNKLGANIGARFTNLWAGERWMSFIQPRLHLTYRPHPRSLFTLSGGRMIQPVHLLNNSGIGFPRDIWVAATPRIRPSESWQMSGSALWLTPGGWGFSLESYYKLMKNLVSFQEGVGTFIDAGNWQNKVTVGEGRAYGLEALVKKQGGRFTGWVSYTLAWSHRQFEDINLGDPYPFLFDRRHSLHITGAVEIVKGFTASLAWTYGTGMATTLPRSSYQYNQFNLLYADLPPQFPFVLDVPGGSRKNDLRLPDYHRLDLEISYAMEKGRAGHRWSLGAYNVYNQFNPLYYILTERVNEAGQLRPTYLQVALFPITASFRYRILFNFRK